MTKVRKIVSRRAKLMQEIRRHGRGLSRNGITLESPVDPSIFYINPALNDEELRSMHDVLEHFAFWTTLKAHRSSGSYRFKHLVEERTASRGKRRHIPNGIAILCYRMCGLVSRNGKHRTYTCNYQISPNIPFRIQSLPIELKCKRKSTSSKSSQKNLCHLIRDQLFYRISAPSLQLVAEYLDLDMQPFQDYQLKALELMSDLRDVARESGKSHILH